MLKLELNPAEESIVYALLCKAKVAACQESDRLFDEEDYAASGMWNERAELICEVLLRMEGQPKVGRQRLVM